MEQIERAVRETRNLIALGLGVFIDFRDLNISEAAILVGTGKLKCSSIFLVGKSVTIAWVCCHFCFGDKLLNQFNSTNLPLIHY